MKGFNVEPGERERLAEIDLAGMAPEIRAAHIGDHVTRRVLDDDDGDVGVVVEIGAFAMAEIFELFLNRRVERRDDDGFGRAAQRQQVLRQMGRVEGKALAARGDRFLHRLLRFAPA